MIESLFIADKQKIRQLMIAIILVGIMVFSYSLFVAYASGLGGYISEKLISSSGTTNSALVIDRFGVSNSNLDVVMGPQVNILPATDVILDGAGTHATLRGTLTTLNGFPTSNVWFEWGYSPAFGSTTPTQVANVAGTYTATINHYIDSNVIYYRFVGQTDGTNYSSTSTFQLTGSGGSPTTASLPLMGVISLLFVSGIIVFMMMVLREVQSSLLVVIILAILIFMGIAFVSGLQSILNSIF